MEPVKQSDKQLMKQRLANGVLIGLIITSLSFLGGWLGARVYTGSSNTGQADSAREAVKSESQLISNIAETVGPSVVSINATSSTTFNRFTGQSLAQQSAGTGFIISDKGYVLTNRHVVPEGVSEISIILDDGTELTDVEVVGRTASTDSLDVAILKINDAKDKTLKVAKLGDSDNMKVGDMVVAIGNALGEFQNSVTSGIVSGFGRSVDAADASNNTETLQNLFQTDAAINQGNSGGPLVNSDGEVIGINTAVATGSAENIGFAIPINDALGLINGIINTGKFQRPYVGVRYIQLNTDRAQELGVSETEGAYISEDSTSGPGVLPDSPADIAGLQPKDIIVKIDDTSITQLKPLTSVVSRYSVGETVTVTFIRDGKTQTVDVTLKALP